MKKLTAMFNVFVGILQRVGCTISNSRNIQKQHATDLGDRAARLMAQGAVASSRITAVLCVCARRGKFAA